MTPMYCACVVGAPAVFCVVWLYLSLLFKLIHIFYNVRQEPVKSPPKLERRAAATERMSERMHCYLPSQFSLWDPRSVRAEETMLEIHSHRRRRRRL